MKTEKRMICFIVSAALLIVTLCFTSCSSTSANVETKTEAETDDHPCYHVTVYSPEIEKVGYACRRKPKYTSRDSYQESDDDFHSSTSSRCQVSEGQHRYHNTLLQFYPLFLFKKNIAKKNCICYNASRQEMSKMFPL